MARLFSVPFITFPAKVQILHQIALYSLKSGLARFASAGTSLVLLAMECFAWPTSCHELMSRVELKKSNPVTSGNNKLRSAIQELSHFLSSLTPMQPRLSPSIMGGEGINAYWTIVGAAAESPAWWGASLVRAPVCAGSQVPDFPGKLRIPG